MVAPGFLLYCNRGLVKQEFLIMTVTAVVCVPKKVLKIGHLQKLPNLNDVVLP